MLSRRRALFQGNQSRPPRPWDYPAVLEYWDARSGVTSSGERVSAWAGRKGFATLEQATGANQPILLPYSGTNYLWLPGVAGNTASAPDSAALSVFGSGALQIDCDVAMDDWAPGAQIGLVSKLTNDGQSAYQFYIGASGELLYRYTATGAWANLVLATSSANLAITNFSRAIVRVSHVFATGAVNFSYSTDGGSTFSALGAEQTITAGTPFDGTDTLTMSTTVGAEAPRKMYGVTIYNGVAGTVVFDADFSAVSEGATSFTESSSNAATVTINSTGSKPAQIVGSQQILADGSAHYMTTASFARAQGQTLIRVMRANTWTSGDCFDDSVGAGSNNMSCFQITASPQFAINAGSSAGTNGGLALNTHGVLATIWNGAGSLTQVNLGTPVTGDAGALAGDGLTWANNKNATAPSNIQSKCLALCNSASSTEQLTALIASINRYHSVF